MNEAPRATIASTYRLQLHAGFTFDDARAVLPYLADLGVTHVYLSPVTTAAPGSTHGYDVIDPTSLNPEFGGDEAYDRLIEEQRRLGLGQIVDVVPNHMGVAPGSGNPYWEHVLRGGRDSRYAHIFDIDWDSADAALNGRLVLPVLADPLDRVLEVGELDVELDDGGWLRYRGGARFPLSPQSLEAWRASGERRDAAALRALVEAQHYRLEHWRIAHETLNYRRFFLIDDLAGVHAEDPRALELTHGLVLELVREGAIDGVRIDHLDGLFDPQVYLERLHEALEDNGAPGAYVVVEKILAAGEPLPEAWFCDGTTGYDYMNEITRVLTDHEQEHSFTSLYERVVDGTPYEEIEERCRLDVVEGPLRPQIDVLARRLYEAARDAEEPVGSDTFARAVRALLGRFPVYRTYHREYALDPRAGELIARALERARETSDVPPAALERAAALLTAPPEGDARTTMMRLQQLMPAVQAKGLEDRAFYRYRRLLSLNEVGGDPGAFGEPVEVFHARVAEATRDWPRRMLATATHDHKRGEDVRARLTALSELPDAWSQAVERAFAALEVGGNAPTVAPADVYLFLQTLLGCYPAGMASARAGDGDLVARLQAYMQKALREAGERSDWLDVNESYEVAVAALVADALGPKRNALFEALEPVLARVARLGAVVSLAQLLLKVAAPGVPDTYQGNELWDLSLVDPDNRRPVDFAQRRTILEGLRAALEDEPAGDEQRRALAPRLLEDWRDGPIKAFVLARALRLRRTHTALFLDGSHEPLAIEGGRAAHGIAFARRAGEATAIVVAPRLPGALLDAHDERLWAPAWGNTTLRLPHDLAGVTWRDAFTGAAIEADASLPLARVLGAFPVALLLPDTASA